jgi:hypothetical protein
VRRGEIQIPDPTTANRARLPMKVAVVSEDFHSLIGSAGRARRFLVFEASRGKRPQLERYLELPEQVPSYHELHDGDWFGARSPAAVEPLARMPRSVCPT